MAAVMSTKNMFVLLGCFVLIAMVAGRPQSTIDSQQDTMDQDGNSLELRRLYNAYNSVPSPISPDERMFLNRLQFETLANYVQQNMPMSGLSDPIFRSPEIKRQVRYRQCYFNPISCFK